MRIVLDWITNFKLPDSSKDVVSHQAIRRASEKGFVVDLDNVIVLLKKSYSSEE